MPKTWSALGTGGAGLEWVVNAIAATEVAASARERRTAIMPSYR